MIKCYLYPRELDGDTFTTDPAECLLVEFPILPPLNSLIHLTEKQAEDWDEINECFKYDGLLTVKQIFFTIMENQPTIQSILLSCEI